MGCLWYKDSMPQHIDRYQFLITPEVLAAKLRECRDQLLKGEEFIFQIYYSESYQNPSEYIPLSIPLNSLEFEGGEFWNIYSMERLTKLLNRYGIKKDTRITLYGSDNSGNYAHIGAFRFASILINMGLTNVYILNGGLNRWKSEGFELHSKGLDPVTKTGNEQFMDRGYILGIDSVRKKLKKGASIISVRSLKEQLGEYSGYDYFNRAGSIPGDIFSCCGSDAYHMERYRRRDNSCRNKREILEKWREEGIFKDKSCIFYCGTGWKASEAWFHGWLNRWENIFIYDGGWFEWSSQGLDSYE